MKVKNAFCSCNIDIVVTLRSMPCIKNYLFQFCTLNYSGKDSCFFSFYRSIKSKRKYVKQYKCKKKYTISEAFQKLLFCLSSFGITLFYSLSFFSSFPDLTFCFDSHFFHLKNFSYKQLLKL